MAARTALMTTTALQGVGVAAAAAYLDAKFHFKKDITSLYRLKKTEKDVIKTVASGRVSLWYRFEDEARRLKDAPDLCLWSREGCYTWNETYQNSCRYAQFFISLGIKPTQLVAFYLTNSPEFMFATMGSWAVGSAPAYINYNLAGEALLHCLRVSKTKVLLVDWDDECRSRIEGTRSEIEAEGIKIYILDEPLKHQIDALSPIRPADELRDVLPPTFPMCLLYTSGSTGLPKAAAFSLARGLGLGGPRARNQGLTPAPNGDSWYNCMPMYHGTGNAIAVMSMTSGLGLAIGKRFSSRGFWNDVRDSGATAFVYVGETARYLLAQEESPLDKEHKIRLMFGNGLRPDVWVRFQERFGIPQVTEFFNSTEGVFGLINVCQGPYLATAVGHHGLILRALMHRTYVPVKADHETGDIERNPKTGFATRMPYDQGGEMLVKIPNEETFIGYWGNSKATQKKFERDLFVKGDLYYRTGDALRRTTDGRWFFMDRLGDTFRWKSENVSTAEVAEVIGKFPGIVEANVYGVLVSGHDGRAGCATVYIPSIAPPTTYSIQTNKFPFAKFLAHLQASLPKYAVPVFLRLLPAATPMHNNKLNKVPYRTEGIDLASIYGAKADGTPEHTEGRDLMMWWPGSLGMPVEKGMDGEQYIEFKLEDLNAIEAKAKKPSKL
ncbi:acetyl-CoA synthetase-like protein [Eremomyces bilateralis CBS 781.70]|uniref:Very long-chain fatty acid transport protein n=1 Tax=Eremomyces bilateralis CBS 781.70 TaxID=1392243 RepID=A0A6G1FTL2_9PEZI|nr:acetyl-CoA synthetase-like protein [Eremomyces bilateralis CBS 781.70]KAF1809093.1 acetyl-CoA synthetase-like protein [Eremomyces bilateralis CBS 781.70]